MTYQVGLPAGHGLTAGTIRVPAAGIELESGTKISCANEAGCQLTITQLPVTGQLSATSTGGQVTVTVDMAAIPVPEPVPEPEPVDEEEEAEEAEEDTEEEEQQAAQPTLEANQRTESLLTALTAAGTPPASSLPVEITVPTRNALTFEQSDYKASSISAPGLRGAKLTRFRGSTQTTVVYTDIELSRSLVKHYASLESTVNPGQITLPTGTFTAGTTNLIAPSSSTTPISDRISISGHGLESLIDADETDRTPTNTKTSFSGRLHDVPGRFVCEGTGCILTVTGAYNDASATSNPNRLNAVTLEATGGGTLYFKPSSASAPVSLCKETTQCLAKDTEYMAFGWWRSEPSGVEGYDFEAFTGGAGLSDAPTGATGTAEYNGTAVGMYVEQSQVGAGTVVKRQGEFIADARLEATFSGDSVGIRGTIDNFNTTPTGGSSAPISADGWVVKLEGASAGLLAPFDDTGDSTSVARIERLGPDGEGTWSRQYVPARTGETNQQPTAVVGTFESEVEEVLNLVGAFGAQRKQ